MGRIQKLIAAGSAAMALACATGQARAAIWILDYMATANPSPVAATLTVTTADIGNGDGSYNVIGVSGVVDNGGGNTDVVAGLIDNPNQPGWAYSTDGRFMFDNLLFPDGAPAVSWYGLLFSGASGDEYNLFSDNASTYEFYRANAGGYQANSYGAVAMAMAPAVFDRQGPAGNAVPEPATWLLMILGFGSVGAVLRRNRGFAGAA